MSALPAADHTLLRNLAPLAAGYAAYLNADRALTRQWAVAAQASDPAAVASLDQWLSYTTDLRDLIDQLVAGYGAPGPLPAAPRPPGDATDPTDQADPTTAADRAPAAVVPPPADPGLRAALDALHDGYPDLVAGCRRVLAALSGLSGQSAASSLRAALLTVWGQYDDALAGLEQRINGEQPAQVDTVDAQALRAEMVAAADFRADLADRLAQAEAWLAQAAAATSRHRAEPEAQRRPTLTTSAQHRVPHRMHWLQDQPPVNAEAFDLYVASRWPTGRSVVDGVPGPCLFLIGRLDGVRLAGEMRARSLLRVRVGPGAAVDGATLGQRPPDLHHQLAAPGSYLLPVAWLPDTQVVGAYRVDPHGRPYWEELPDELVGQPLASCPADARHGAAGLPNEVAYWPSRRVSSAAIAYTLIPEPPPHPVPDRLTLYRERPRVRPGQRLLELYVERGRAIDIATTVEQLGPLPQLRSIAYELLAGGVELVLPRRSYSSVQIKRVWHPGRGWRPPSSSRSPSLTSLLGDEVSHEDHPTCRTG